MSGTFTIENASPDVQQYIASLGAKQRERVIKIVERVVGLVPGTEIKHSYGIVGFSYKKRALLYVGGWETYVSVYPIPELPAPMLSQLSKYKKGKGTLQFAMTEELPFEFIDSVILAHRNRIDNL